MRSPEYKAGFLIGFGLILIIFFVILLLKNKKLPKPQYDEMQVAARGKAFKAGFFGLLIANVVGMFLSTSEISWLSDIFIFATASMAGAAVFCVSAVCNDAYFGFNENRRSSTLFIAALGLLNLILGIIHIVCDGALEDGKLNTGFLSLMVALLAAVIVVSVLIHNRKTAVLDAEGEDE